jgi:hypothetical protein
MAVERMRSTPIVYFNEEGRENLMAVIKVVRSRLKKQPQLRNLKLVIFTAYGEGPARAYSMLEEYEPKIIAVTCPPDFAVAHGDKTYKPRIDPKVRKFFNGVGIKVLTGRLPFDTIEGMDGHNREMQILRNALSIFGGGVIPCLQAVLQACDMGELEIGEQVIAVSGDWAILVTASTTNAAFTRENGVSINEIFCKPNRFDICRVAVSIQSESDKATESDKSTTIEGKDVPKQLQE